MDDIPPLARFFKKVYTGFGSYGTIDLFQWKIIDNRVMRGIINLVKDGNQIVSATSVTPKELYLMGEKYSVAEIGDTYTDPDYQRQGMFALLINQSTRDASQKGISFIYGTPNHQSLPGYEKKANYKTIPELKLKSLVFPVDIGRLIPKRSHWLLGKGISFLFSLFIFLYATAKKIFRKSADGFVEEMREIPEGWDAFWEKARHKYDFILARHKEAFEWRFFLHPNKYSLYILKNKGEIAGYVACRFVCDPEITRLIIADFLFLPGKEEGLLSLLDYLLKKALRSNTSFINVWCPEMNPYFALFRKFGFRVRQEVPVICFQNEFALNLQKNCGAWHFTMSDSDNV